MSTLPRNTMLQLPAPSTEAVDFMPLDAPAQWSTRTAWSSSS
ncbi:hypothetical protein ACFC58_43035 [Kitasatospora purpeofusca]